jgi:hypothetical protein
MATGLRHTPSATVDQITIEAVLRPFGQSRTLPAAAFTDSHVFAWEYRFQSAPTSPNSTQDPERAAP